MGNVSAEAAAKLANLAFCAHKRVHVYVLIGFSHSYDRIQPDMIQLLVCFVNGCGSQAVC